MWGLFRNVFVTLINTIAAEAFWSQSAPGTYQFSGSWFGVISSNFPFLFFISCRRNVLWSPDHSVAQFPILWRWLTFRFLSFQPLFKKKTIHIFIILTLDGRIADTGLLQVSVIPFYFLKTIKTGNILTFTLAWWAY
jgi:hypothetical protein